MMLPGHIMDLYGEIVRSIASLVDDSWERIVLNYEMEYDGEEITHDSLCFYVGRDGDGQLEKTSLSLTAPIREYFGDLNDALLQHSGQRWGRAIL